VSDRPLTREEARRRLTAVVKEIVPGSYAAERMTQLLDMHLTRNGLAIVTIEERGRLTHKPYTERVEALARALADEFDGWEKGTEDKVAERVMARIIS